MSRVIFSANDPGGAHAILPVVAALVARGTSVTGYLTGPATAVFSAAHIPFIDAGQLSDDEVTRQIDVSAPELFLAGTSGGPTLDKRILRHIGKLPSVSVLDYWSNYAQRFSEEGSDLRRLPTRICVPDARAAEEMREAGIDPSRIVVTGNPYFETFADTVTREQEVREHIVFISQPISADARRASTPQYDFDEFTALEGCIVALEVLPPVYRLFIRLHPRDDPHKFDAYLSERVQLALEPVLEVLLSRAGLVIGMYSPVLIQAALAGKSVVSYQPLGTNPDPLPSNQLGGTIRATTQGGLEKALLEYGAGQTLGNASAVARLCPPGCVTRILACIDALMQKHPAT